MRKRGASEAGERVKGCGMKGEGGGVWGEGGGMRVWGEGGGRIGVWGRRRMGVLG